MKSDIEIAHETRLLPITEVAGKLGVSPEDLELYGPYKAKFTESFLRRIENLPDGKLILVTAINPRLPAKAKPQPQLVLARRSLSLANAR